MIAYSVFPTDPRIRRESEVLAEQGNEVNFLVLAENARPSAYRKNGVNLIEMRMNKHRGNRSSSYFLPYLKFLGLAFWHCSRLFMHGKVDVVHVHNMPNFLVFAGILPRLFGKKVILDIHDSVPETYAGKFGRLPKVLHKLLCLEESVCCSFANQLICVNDVQKEKLLDRGINSDKVSVLLNVPDHKIFQYEKRSQTPRKNTFDIVYHGTLDKMLGIDLAIEMVSRLASKIPGIHLHILGEGRNLEELETLSIKSGLRSRVHFSRKSFPVEKLPELLRGMDLGIIPNKKNTATELMLPVKMLEYVAIGIPVVAPRLRTIERYFSDDMVAYFDPGDADSMAQAIFDLYLDREKREQQAASAKKFDEKYGWQNHQRELIRLYEKL